MSDFNEKVKNHPVSVFATVLVFSVGVIYGSLKVLGYDIVTLDDYIPKSEVSGRIQSRDSYVKLKKIYSKGLDIERRFHVAEENNPRNPDSTEVIRFILVAKTFLVSIENIDKHNRDISMLPYAAYEVQMILSENNSYGHNGIGSKEKVVRVNSILEGLISTFEP